MSESAVSVLRLKCAAGAWNQVSPKFVGRDSRIAQSSLLRIAPGPCSGDRCQPEPEASSGVGSEPFRAALNSAFRTIQPRHSLLSPAKAGEMSAKRTEGAVSRQILRRRPLCRLRRHLPPGRAGCTQGGMCARPRLRPPESGKPVTVSDDPKDGGGETLAENGEPLVAGE
jgi:hypothetical protein